MLLSFLKIVAVIVLFLGQSQAWKRGPALERGDGRCGPAYPINGRPGQCHAYSRDPCCSEYGWCGHTDKHCKCPSCTDYDQKGPGDSRSGYCTPWFCFNGGSCVDMAEFIACDCPIGFSGDRCQIRVNPPISCSDGEYSYVPHPNICPLDYFYACINGRGWQVKCSPGCYYDMENGQCDCDKNRHEIPCFYGTAARMRSAFRRLRKIRKVRLDLH